MSLSILILAAGKGTRMRSSTPKVLHDISGKAMLFHILDAALALSDDVSVVLGHEADRVQSEIESCYKGVNFLLQDLQNFPGTGGALKGYKPKHDYCVILNGDMPLVTTDSIKALHDSNSDITLSYFEPQSPEGYGRVKITNGKVERIIEQKDCNEEELKIGSVNAGVYGIKSELLDSYIPKLENNNAQKEYYLTDIIEMGVDENRAILAVRVDEEEFKGVNSKFDLSNAEQIMQNRIKKHWMMQGVSMQLPETIYIDASATFEGECRLEMGVSIIGACTIEQSIIKAHSVIEQSTISHSDVGPLAHIRPQSTISQTHIGNFVEVKKSTLNGVKAGHLSYLGDSEINQGTNIGAGTITCNYDGLNKHQTVIGKNVFVGSDTQLVAPLEIPDDVMIAAGSTVTKSPQKGDLVLSRAPQKSIKNFFYKFFGKTQ